jgi:hypothetical protein
MTPDESASDPSAGPRARPRSRRGWFVALLALAFLILQETVLRVLFPVAEVRNFNRIHYSALLSTGDRTPPPLRNARYHFESRPDGFRFVHQLNLYGFRDRPWRIRRAPGVARWMFVGDSFTEGAGAPGGSTLVDGFRGAGPDLKLEVMNFGIQGIGVGHYLTLLGDAVPLFRPDQVVLVLMANDFGNMGSAGPEAVARPYGGRGVELPLGAAAVAPGG